MDDLNCDSTWEDESEEDGEDGQEDDTGDADTGDEDDDAEETRPGVFQPKMMGYRNWRAMQDMQRYRHRYPDLADQDCNGDMSNLSFYKNEICFQPNGSFIEEILQKWKDNYELLEENHSYIQWLFPLREPGVNWHAKPLTLKEIDAFKSSMEVKERLVQAYELMLGFYGIQLKDRDTGAVCRAQNFKSRFDNLNRHSHNNLRITRILKSLGELGLEHYQAPLVRFFLEETLVENKLPSVRQSALDYFLFAVRCRHQRRELVHFAWKHFKPRCQFVWGPHDKLRRFRPQPLWALGQADKDEGSRNPSQEAGTRGRTYGSGRNLGGDRGTTEDPRLLSTKTQDDVGTLDGDQRGEAESLSPKESKKRKLEGNRQEQSPWEADPQVEKIVHNLEGCALSPSSQKPREAEQPCPVTHGAEVTDEVRKRRKLEEGTGGDGVASNHSTDTLCPALPPTPSECPEAQKDENGPEDPESQVGTEDPESQVESEDPESQVESEDPESQVGVEYPESQVGAEDPESQVGVEYPESQVESEDPESQVGVEYPESQVGVEYPESQVGVEQGTFGNLVEHPDTTEVSVGESERLAGMGTSAEPPKP
ncbi:opioid growth factor receptor isoform X12 [Alexandromys fortis]|uniref:opioid growth factor receptor isoform X12 n=1 Tax=Alexandromys fortis TaxID=100897 RepID=UPI002152BEDD|nr:opioid growth factor receptor isoform X12 [Microtus fortis]